MRGSWTDRLAGLAGLLLIAVLQVHRLDDSDTWWHLASGRLIADTGTVVRGDPFSFTAPEAPWVNRQWLFELGLYGLWVLGGAAAVALGCGALYLGAFAAAWRLAQRRLPAWAAAIVVLLAALITVERFTARPEAVTLCLLATSLLVLDGRIGWRAVALLVAMQVVWANCHALSVLGVGVIGLALAGTLVARWVPLPAGWTAASRRPPDEEQRLGVALVGSAIAEACTPFGLTGALFPLRLLTVIRGRDVTSLGIVEHRPTALAELSPAAAFGLVALVALAALAAMVSFRRWRLSSLLTAATFVALGAMARRNVALVGLGVLPFVAEGFGPLARRLAAASHRLVPTLNLAMAVTALVVAGWVVRGTFYQSMRMTRAFGLGESRLLFSAGAVDWLQANAPEARVFNDDLLGGWLLWRAWPQRRVFFDGRLQMYPPAVYEEYEAALADSARFAALAERRGIGAVVLHHPAPGRLELAGAIGRMPGWRIAYLDGGAIVLVRDGQPTSTVEGVTGPTTAIEATGAAALLETVVAPLRVPVEEAVSRYQRGRALLWLWGPRVAPLARADFEAALALWPGFDAPATGLRSLASVPRP
ncbi:MAG: hypothetical protein KIT14_09115 [bacterium]|nr:hypothetical protein [bacterium]